MWCLKNLLTNIRWNVVFGFGYAMYLYGIFGNPPPPRIPGFHQNLKGFGNPWQPTNYISESGIFRGSHPKCISTLAQETSWPIWEAIDQTHQSHGPIYAWYIYRSMCHKKSTIHVGKYIIHGWYGNGWLFHGVPMIPNELNDGPLSQAICRVFSRHIFCHKRWKHARK